MSDYISQTTEKMEGLYSAMLSSIFNEMRYDNSQGSIVNIITNYPWSLNASNISNSGRIPAVYVKEYRQKLSTFTSSLKHAATGVTNAIGGATFFDKGVKVTADNHFNTIISESNGHLSPYFNMYSLDSTDCLNYVFPQFKGVNIEVKNSYERKNQAGDGMLTAEMSSVISALTGIDRDITEIRGLLDLYDNNSNIGDEGIYVEKPKYFQYDASNDNITVQFILYNTIPSTYNASPWKKNYRFIKNFTLKNLPYKISFFAYKTPALYEVCIPGIKYFPVSFVSNFSASNIGVTRMLTFEGNQQVLVPEAWQVTITFQSLLNNSANIFKTALSSGLNIMSRAVQTDGIDGKSTIKDPTKDNA